MDDSPTERLDELMDRYVFGLLDEVAAARVRRRIEAEPEWQLAYEAAVGRKRLLGNAVRRGAAEAAATQAPSPDDVLAAARATAQRRRVRRRASSRVLAGLAAAACLAIGVAWARVGLMRTPTQTLRLVGQTELMAGTTASLRAIVSSADGRPRAGVPVTIRLPDPNSQQNVPVVLAEWQTGDDGSAAGEIQVPDWPDGQHNLIVDAGRISPARLDVPIAIRRPVKLYLATDKPIYQPGQTIHMRCLALRKPSLRPLAGEPAELSVTDPSGNIVFVERRTLSDYGIASADLPTDPLLSPGRYTVRVAVGGSTSEQTAEVFHYKLPAFAVAVRCDRPYYLPGQTLTGRVELRYHFGKPVAGGEVDLALTAEPIAGLPDSLARTTATTDAQGRAGFEFVLPATLFGSARTSGDVHLLLTARATDSAGQENTGYARVVAAHQDLRIAVVAENGQVSPRVEGRLFIVTSYPDGRPAAAIVTIEGLARSVRSDEAGVAVVAATDPSATLRVSARDDAGRTGRTEVSLPSATGGAMLLRTDKPIYDAGETVNVEVLAPTASEVFLDVVKDRQTMGTRTLAVANGRATLALDLGAELAGTLQLHAYRLSKDGEWVSRDALIVVRPARQLHVAVQRDQDTYRPGHDATLVFRVADPSGKGIPAALSLAAVDEAVYSVQQAAPGFEKTLLGLDEELLQPAIQTLQFSPFLMDRSADYARAALAAAVVPTEPSRPRLQRLADEGLVVSRMFEGIPRAEIRAALQRDPYLRESLAPEVISELLGSASAVHSLDVDNAEQVWQRYHTRKETASDTASIVTVAGVLLLYALGLWAAMRWLAARTSATAGFAIGLLAVFAFLAVLVAVTLPSLSRARELGVRASALANLRGIGQAMMIVDASVSTQAAYPGPEADEGPDGSGVRVRSYFPETMLWRPEVITDPTGTAKLTIPLADSITTWRLSGTAVSRAGQLGTVDSSLRVFQPFFVEVDAPASLTRGDEVSLPLVLYNYTDGPLDVALRATAADGLTLLDGAEQSVALAASEVKRVRVRVRAEAAGEAMLGVEATGGGLTDAVRRPVRINHPGLPRSLVVNHTIVDGEQDVLLTIPDEAVPGSVGVAMKIYPSTFSELLDGLESILRMPHGCFEQTSSTTYPNVMALAYMKANGIASPEILATATRYIQLGCQRLLSFEVNGGGFSLFGEAPANLVLTGYGLMEFADMAKVHAVDTNLLHRTANWLARQQHADGSWTGGSLIESGGSPDGPLASTAYVTWAVAMHDPREDAARRGADYVARRLDSIRDAHTLALCINALRAAGHNRAAIAGAQRRLAGLADRTAKADVHWSAGPGAMTCCYGGFADVETTGLAVLALVGAPEHQPLVVDALGWLSGQRDPYGTWGTTQSTVLALKALLAGSQAPRYRDVPAEMVVTYPTASGPRTARKTVPAEQTAAVQTLPLDGLSEPGRHSVQFAGQGAAGMGCQLVVRYHSFAAAARQPAEAPLGIDVQYDRTTLQSGETVGVRAVVTNRTDSPATMLLADIGTPPGFVVRPAKLEALRAAGRIDRYTLTARGVIVYISAIGPREALAIDYEMTATMPLRAVAAPTTVYAYYDPDRRAVAAAPRVEVR